MTLNENSTSSLAILGDDIWSGGYHSKTQGGGGQ